NTLVASIHAPLGLDPPFPRITSASRLQFKKFSFSMLFNRQSTADRLRQMPRWHAQHLANILPAFVWVKEFMSKLWVSAWLEFQCDDLPAHTPPNGLAQEDWMREIRGLPHRRGRVSCAGGGKWPWTGDASLHARAAACPGRCSHARRWRSCVGASPHFGPPGLGTGVPPLHPRRPYNTMATVAMATRMLRSEGSLRRPALAPSLSCSTMAIVLSQHTDSRSPAPVALHAAAPPCPLAIVPLWRGRGHGNLDFLARTPATACARPMWAALHFHPVPPLVLHEEGPPRPPTIAAHHRTAAAGTHACREPGFPHARWKQRVRGRQEVLYSTSTHSLYRAGRRGGRGLSRNARRCADGRRQGGRSGRAICAQWSVEGR
ncbi:hypothetical protein B0H14DRAFT_3621245, partial [Mycena olivaceomarginata]